MNAEVSRTRQAGLANWKGKPAHIPISRDGTRRHAFNVSDENQKRSDGGLFQEAAPRVSDTSGGTTNVARRTGRFVWPLVGFAAGWACMIAGSRWLNDQVDNRRVTETPATLFVGGMIMCLTCAIRAIVIAFAWIRSRER